MAFIFVSNVWINLYHSHVKFQYATYHGSRDIRQFSLFLGWPSYSSRTIYLISLKLLGQGVLELSFTQGVEGQHYLWPTDPNTRSNTGHLCKSSRTRVYVSTFQVWRIWGEAFLSYLLHMVKGDRHTDRQVQSNMPLLRKGRGIYKYET